MTSDLTTLMAAYREAWHRDGVVHIPGALDADNLVIAREMFDWSRAHPGQAAWDVALGSPEETVFIDTHNPEARVPYRDLLARSVMPEIAAAVLGVDAVWFLGEQIFVKQGAQGSRSTPWHQDSDLPIDATGALAMWMAFESLDVDAGLKFVRGSHRGPCLNPIRAVDERGTPQYLYPASADMPPFPDIDADAGGYDIVAWPYQPGDLILFHSMTIHGGATVPAGGKRNTLCTRFIGPAVTYRSRGKRESNGNLSAEGADYLWEDLQQGMPLHRGRHFFKLFDSRAG